MLAVRARERRRRVRRLARPPPARACRCIDDDRLRGSRLSCVQDDESWPLAAEGLVLQLLATAGRAEPSSLARRPALAQRRPRPPARADARLGLPERAGRSGRRPSGPPGALVPARATGSRSASTPVGSGSSGPRASWLGRTCRSRRSPSAQASPTRATSRVRSASYAGVTPGRYRELVAAEGRFQQPGPQLRPLPSVRRPHQQAVVEEEREPTTGASTQYCLPVPGPPAPSVDDMSGVRRAPASRCPAPGTTSRARSGSGASSPRSRRRPRPGCPGSSRT